MCVIDPPLQEKKLGRRLKVVMLVVSLATSDPLANLVRLIKSESIPFDFRSTSQAGRFNLRDMHLLLAI